jgi:hypothetical protein
VSFRARAGVHASASTCRAGWCWKTPGASREGARSWRGSLRDRLLAAFVLVGVPPVLLLAVAVTTLVSRSFDETAARRLEGGPARRALPASRRWSAARPPR